MSSIPVKFIVGVMLFAMATYAAPTNAKAAIAEASKAGQILGLIFHEAQDTSLSRTSSSITTFNKSSTKNIAVYKANLSDPANKEIAE